MKDFKMNFYGTFKMYYESFGTTKQSLVYWAKTSPNNNFFKRAKKCQD
jgi:hypothetical protein